MAAAVNITKVWEETQGRLKDQLGSTSFETWILPLKPRLQGDQ